MYPELFKLGPLTIYSYGVLLAASYLLGLRLAMARGKRWGLDPNRVLDLGIYIIVAALVVGGAAGNLVDGLLLGHVVDFLDFYWGGWHFWSFNVADAAITIGAVLVFVELLLVNRHASDPV